MSYPFLDQSKSTPGAIEVKALPSQPVWVQLSDVGTTSMNPWRLRELIAIYENNAHVHGSIDLLANNAVSAKPCVMKVVNQGAKNLGPRKLKSINTKRLKKVMRQWDDVALARKSVGDDETLADASDTDFGTVLNSKIGGTTLHQRIRLTVIDLSACGISYWQRVRDVFGRVAGYRYLPAMFVTPERGEDGSVVGWFFSSYFGAVVNHQPIPVEDMVVFSWASPVDPQASGDSPLKSALRQIALSEKWLAFQDWLISNRARPDGVFIPKMPDSASLTPEQVQAQEKRINDKFRGPGNGRWAIAEQQGTYVPLTFSPTDMAPLAFNEELRKAILFALKIPEALTNNDGNRSNIVGSLEQFARFSLAPIINILEEVLNGEASEFDTTLIVVFENVIPSDALADIEEEKFELTKWQYAVQYGGIDNNDYRVNVLGLEPIEKPEPDTETAIPPVPVADPVDDEDKPDTTDKSMDLLDLNRLVAKGTIDRATGISLLAHSHNISEEDAKKLITHAKTPKSKRKAFAALATFIKSLSKPPTVPPSKGLADIVALRMGQQKTHYLNQLKGNFPVKSAKGVDGGDGLPTQFKSLDEWDGEDAQLYKPYIQVAYNETSQSRMKSYADVGADPDVFSVVPDQINAAVDNASLKFAESTNDTTEKDINDALDELRTELGESLNEGDSVKTMTQKIEDIFENISKERAKLIAQTEMSRATHDAQKITAKASGIVKGFVLQTDPDCCDICKDLDGEEIPVDGKFNKADTYSDCPCPLHPFCRCSMLEVIDFDKLGDDES